MTVTVYSTMTCPYCKMLMDYLDEKQIHYTKKLVDQDEDAKNEMANISGGFLGVPYTVVDKDGLVEKVVGFDKNKLDEILK
ncbi:glutaredoxin family protein [Candidatus Woesebacteria bacterium]|nr:MAG: glutaredoxin family protein [Candidatus Woesebacteria bacterium]